MFDGDKTPDINPSPDSRKIAVAISIPGAADASHLTLEPGKTSVIVAAILSDLDCKYILNIHKDVGSLKF